MVGQRRANGLPLTPTTLEVVMPQQSINPYEYRCAACDKMLMFADGLTGVVNLSCRRCKAITAIVDGVAQSLRPEYRAVSLNSIGGRQALTPHEIRSLEARWNLTIAEHTRKRSLLAVGMRFKVFQRDGFKCAYCGRTPADGALLEADHIFPKSKGGEDTMDNLVTSCAECNRGKSDRVLTG